MGLLLAIVGKSVGRTDLEEKVSSQYEFVFNLLHLKCGLPSGDVW